MVQSRVTFVQQFFAVKTPRVFFQQLFTLRIYPRLTWFGRGVDMGHSHDQWWVNGVSSDVKRDAILKWLIWNPLPPSVMTSLLWYNFSTSVVVDHDVHVFELDAPLCARVIWCFLGGPPSIWSHVVNVMCLPFGFENPTRNRGVRNRSLVEMKHNVFTIFDLQHDNTFLLFANLKQFPLVAVGGIEPPLWPYESPVLPLDDTAAKVTRWNRTTCHQLCKLALYLRACQALVTINHISGPHQSRTGIFSLQS